MIELRSISTENMQKLRVIIIGGSLGGLCAALALRHIGCDVEVFERSPQEMIDPGAGLVMQPELIHLLEGYGIATREEVSVPSPIRQFLGRDGAVFGQHSSYQLMTSWGAIYRRLKAAFPHERYHYAHKLVRFELNQEQVKVYLANGCEEVCDLLVCADGANSTCRHQLLPNVVPHYAGYVAWRGVINETQISAEVAEILADKFTFFNSPSTQMLSYLIPTETGENEIGKRRFNWVWYWQVREGTALRDILTDRTGLFRDYSVPQGSIRPELIKQQWAIAQKILPDVFVYLFTQTKEP
ncbi:MAG TPA: FAD-dependent monooxygenase, partial [Cyanobacteria bacterium UBA11049]|nr:FAD-dependent monooxygenase [Cyanobacteria bacterium UBA11049]